MGEGEGEEEEEEEDLTTLLGPMAKRPRPLLLKIRACSPSLTTIGISSPIVDLRFDANQFKVLGTRYGA